MPSHRCFLLPFICLALHAAATTNPLNPDCPNKCGNITINYPFGIGPACSLDPSLTIFCDDSLEPPKPYLRQGVVAAVTAVNFYQRIAPEVISISESQVLIRNPPISSVCYNQSGNDTITSVTINFSETSFTLSATDNKLTLIGCDDRMSSFLISYLGGECESTCRSINDVKKGCTAAVGQGCCQTSISGGVQQMYTQPSSIADHLKVFSFNPCSYIFLGDPSNFTFRGASDLSDPTFVNRIVDSVPIVLDWQISNQSCSEIQKTTQYPCMANSHCQDSDIRRGYHCICNDGYSGNAYLTPGCQDVNECAYKRDDKNYPCVEICLNTEGSYECSCPNGYFGDGKRNGTGCIKRPKEVAVLKISLASGFSALAVVICLALLYVTMEKRKILRRRETFFEQNGGLLLKQQLFTSTEDTVVSRKVFTVEELERATNNFSQKSILGQGGSGTVYKGILDDKCVVAIKKSKFMEKTQIEEFINEVIILTQVNHRNVVKLLGCCLETEVPLLVYEYVSEGTLQHHIEKSKEMPWFSWDNRLRIAIEAAGALSYLHSAASIPVIHRDVKSANILLDDYYTTKISDFGASRLVPLDQSKINTLVQGTLGYLDPEYFQTGDLTEKSDVYSFGVVLAELLTGKKPLHPIGDDRSLAKLIIQSIQENSLFKIVDHRVLKEGSFEQLQDVGNLIVQCLHVKGEERPTMREVSMELERLRKFAKHQWVHESNLVKAVEPMNKQPDLYATFLDEQDENI